MKSDSKSEGSGDWYTAKEVAGRLKVSERSVRRWIAEGDLCAHRFGRAVRVSEEDLVAFEKKARQ